MVILEWLQPPAEVGDAYLFLLLGSVSAALLSMAKAGFGGSMGLLSVPLMIYACGDNTKLAIGIMLPVLIACDYISMVVWRGKWDRRAVAMLLPGLAAGVGLGWLALWSLRYVADGGEGSLAQASKNLADAALMGVIGIIAIGFVLLQAVRTLRAKPLAFRPVFWQASCAGTAMGVTSTLAHAAGPISTMYFLSQQIPKGRYVATTVLTYWIGNQLKLVPYVALGMIYQPSLRASVILAPAVVAGTLLGFYLHNRVNQRHFNVVVYTLLALAGVHMITKAAQSFLA